MSIEKKAFEGASWLALFKLISQIFSWLITVIVARILIPDDYGLMAMATIITGYALYLNELGLGAAIIQKKKIIQSELSSVFWIMFSISILFAIICFFGAYFMAYIFNEPRIIPLIQTISVIFPLNALQVIPVNLLKKALNFKKVGLIEMAGTFVSCSCMYFIARKGGGVWTLVGGTIILSLTKLVLIYLSVKWLPQLHFNFREAISYLTFGITIFIGRSFFYMSEQSDRFFAGRAWPPHILGYYGFALQLAQIPTEKIVVLINQVSFSVFSKLQEDKQKFNKFYLNVIKVTATLVVPIFVGGYLLGEDIIKLLLNEKWYPIIFVFKYLCLAQIFTSLNAINSFVQYALGRPQWSLYYHVISAILMATSFYFAVQFSLNAILIPWFTTYILICTIWTILTLNKIGIKLNLYLKNLFNPIMATLLMSIGVILYDYTVVLGQLQNINTLLFSLVIKITLGILIYSGYFCFFDRQIFYSIKNLRRA